MGIDSAAFFAQLNKERQDEHANGGLAADTSDFSEDADDLNGLYGYNGWGEAPELDADEVEL